MVERRDIASWLEGPRSVTGGDVGYPGQRLGRPESGAGSVARFGRRFTALAIDWAVCLLIAHAFFGGGRFAPLGILLAELVLLVGTLGSTVGHRALGLSVERLDGGAPGPLKALVRGVLLVLVVPPLIWDRDQRGLHDKAAGTLVVLARRGGQDGGR